MPLRVKKPFHFMCLPLTSFRLNFFVKLLLRKDRLRERIQCAQKDRALVMVRFEIK